MVTCPATLTAITTSCGSNMGGVREVCIGNFGLASFEYEYQVVNTLTQDEYTALNATEQAKYELVDENYVQYAKDSDGEKVKAAIKSATLEGTEKMKKFAFREQTASFTQTLQANDNGINFWEQNINLVFAKSESIKRLAIMSLMMGQTQAIVVDNNKKMWLCGVERPLRMTSAENTTGTAFTDDNAYTITLACSDTLLALPINEEVYNTLVEA